MIARSGVWTAVGIGLIVFTFALPAAAYIDAGTASLIFQALIAGGLAALLAVKQFWANIKAFFQSVFRGGAQPKQGE